MPRRNGKKKKTAVKSRFHLLGYERELAEYSRAELKRIILQHSSETAIPSAKASRVSKADELLAPKQTNYWQAIIRKAKYSGVKDPNAKTAGLRLGKLIWKETGWLEIAGTMDDGKLVKIDGSTEKAKDVIETTSSDLARNQRSQHGGHDRYWLVRMNPVTIWNESDADAQKRQKEFAQKHSIRMGHWIDIHFGQTVVAEAASLGLMDHEQNKEPIEAGNEKEQNDG
eukprot:221765_1